MAISERRFASELIDAEGAVYKFDDLACMLRFRRQRRPHVAAGYVMDFQRARWIEAARAHVVQSAAFQTPMGGGMAAFEDRAAAARHAGAAAVLRFADLAED